MGFLEASYNGFEDFGFKKQCQDQVALGNSLCLIVSLFNLFLYLLYEPPFNL